MIITLSLGGMFSIVINVSVCLSLCLYKLHISETTQLNFFMHADCGHGLVLFWWHCDILFFQFFCEWHHVFILWSL